MESARSKERVGQKRHNIAHKKTGAEILRCLCYLLAKSEHIEHFVIGAGIRQERKWDFEGLSQD